MGEVINPMKLYLPDAEEGVDIDDLNENFQKINTGLGNLGGAKPYADTVVPNFYDGLAVGGQNADFTMAANGLVRQGGLAYFFIEIVIRRNMSIDTGTGGLTDAVPLLIIKDGFRPKFDCGMSTSSGSDRIVAMYATTNGSVILKAVSGNVGLVAGTRLKASGIYFIQ